MEKVQKTGGVGIAGELLIKLQQKDSKIDCQIHSTRPTQVSRLFQGKTIAETLSTIPLLFNICSKAQSVTAVRAIESATNCSVSPHTESIREALITLESLREQCLRIAIDWPAYIQENTDKKMLSYLGLNINQLIQSLNPQQTLSYQANVSTEIKTQNNWSELSSLLSNSIFAMKAEQWRSSISLEHQTEQINKWAEKKQTQAARFIHWLNQKDWKEAGASKIKPLPMIKDEELLTVLKEQQQSFTALPDWKNQTYELSWFNKQHTENNGIYSRMLARLIEIADLIIKLDAFFNKNKTLIAPRCSAAGMAHTHAARGRLSHYVELENGIINNLLILAPTEWNFHPQGVAQDSLCNLQASPENEIRQQAELLIHAIDPCVSYQLNITS